MPGVAKAALSLYRAAQKEQADAARAFTAHIAHQEFVSVQLAAMEAE